MTDTMVQMRALHARDERGTVLGLDLSLPAGTVGALIGAPSDGSSALGRVLSGALRPSAGSVLVAGQNPFASPLVRRRIGALLDTPLLPDVGSVRELVALARGLRGDGLDRPSWYEELGIPELERVKVGSLTLTQARTVSLALALLVPDPALLVLHEPLADLIQTSSELLRPLLRSRAQAGACVLVITASTADAVGLADDVATLSGGRIGRAIGSPDVDALVPDQLVELRVWCSAPRALASALSLDECVKAVFWGAQDPRWPLVLRTSDVVACAAAVWRAGAKHSFVIHAMKQVVPGTAELHQATLRAAASGGAQTRGTRS